MLNIECALTNLIRPPKCEFRNYSGSFSKHFNNFSKFEDDITTFDETKICMTLLKNVSNSNSEKICIVYTHSHGSCKEEGFQLLEACALAKFSLCLYDSRGSGKSSETNLTFGEKEHIDLLFVCFNLMVMYDLHEFILWGRSIGTCTVLRLAQQLQLLNMDNSIRKGYAINKILEEKPTLNVEKHFLLFLELNKLICVGQQLYRVIGVVLDSPIRSMNDAIEQFVKNKLMNFSVVSKFASFFTEKWIKSKINVDITQNQNFKLVQEINLPGVFMLSKIDEMTEFIEGIKMANEYGIKVSKNSNGSVCEMEKNHKEARETRNVVDAINILMRNSFSSGHRFEFILNNLRSVPIQKKEADKPSRPLSQSSNSGNPGYRLRCTSPLLTNIKTLNFSTNSETHCVKPNKGLNLFQANVYDKVECIGRKNVPLDIQINGRFSDTRVCQPPQIYPEMTLREGRLIPPLGKTSVVKFEMTPKNYQNEISRNYQSELAPTRNDEYFSSSRTNVHAKRKTVDQSNTTNSQTRNSVTKDLRNNGMRSTETDNILRSNSYANLDVDSSEFNGGQYKSYPKIPSLSTIHEELDNKNRSQNVLFQDININQILSPLTSQLSRNNQQANTGIATRDISNGIPLKRIPYMDQKVNLYDFRQTQGPSENLIISSSKANPFFYKSHIDKKTNETKIGISDFSKIKSYQNNYLNPRIELGKAVYDVSGRSFNYKQPQHNIHLNKNVADKIFRTIAQNSNTLIGFHGKLQTEVFRTSSYKA